MKTDRPQSQLALPLQQVLYEDLIVEILSWLPVKSLLQFRCVCKYWKTLISDPKFVKLHLQRSARNPKLLLMSQQFSSVYEAYILSVIPCSVGSFLQNPSSISAEYDCYRVGGDNGNCIIGSCNGLVCFRGRGSNFGDHRFYLWNPATRSTSVKFSSLRFDGGYIPCNFAFGYDNLNDVYKVVTFCVDSKAEDKSQKIQVKVCSLSDNRRRSIQSFSAVPFDVPHFPCHKEGVYFSGTLNWLALRNINSDDYKWNNTITVDKMVIVSLDLGMETYTLLLLPHLDEG